MGDEPSDADLSDADLSDEDRATVAAFTSLCYRRWRHDRPGGRGPLTLSWLGSLVQKLPGDLWVLQELVVETRPDVIVECGSGLGGSALFLASVCDLLDPPGGQVLSVDLAPLPERRPHPRVTQLIGDSVDMAPQVRARIPAGARVMVILDSDHRRDHVAGELAAYAELVSPGCYLVVEDTAVNGHPILPDHGPGPMEALVPFLAARRDFVVDRSRERFLVTMNPGGFLRRMGS